MTLAVVIATYNGAEFIAEQLDSVINQTLRPDEIIICDDSSSDNTWEIIDSYRRRYPDLFKVFRNEARMGPHQNFKSAFHHTNADLIAPCDQDDIWFPEKLERSVKAIQLGYDFVFCQERIQYEISGICEVFHSMPSLKECVFGCQVPGHLIVFKRDLLNVFSIAPEITYDWGVLLMAASRGTGVAIEYVGCLWRRHSTAVTTEYSDFNVKNTVKEGKWKKFSSTIGLLRKGKSSPVIARRLSSVSRIIGSIDNSGKRVRLAYKVALSVSKQSVIEQLKASYYYMCLNSKEDSFKTLSLKAKIGSSLYAFCYPSIWWYDFHDHDAL